MHHPTNRIAHNSAIVIPYTIIIKYALYMGNGDVDMNKQTNMNAMTRSGGIHHRQGLDLHNEVWHMQDTAEFNFYKT